MGGLPILIPEGIKALLSPGTVFLLIEIETSLITASILPPSVPLLLISATKRWLSVPPETTLNPLLSKYSQPALLFLNTYIKYNLLVVDKV